MKVIGAEGLDKLVNELPACAPGAIAAWHAEVAAAEWASGVELLRDFPQAVTDARKVRIPLDANHCAIIRVNYGARAVLIEYLGPNPQINQPTKRRNAKCAA